LRICTALVRACFAGTYVQLWFVHILLVRMYSSSSCMFCWYVCTALVRACFAGTYIQLWFVHVLLVHMYSSGSCMFCWYACTALVRACFAGTCVQLWFVHILLIHILERQLATQITIHNDQSSEFREHVALGRADFAGTHSLTSARYSIYSHTDQSFDF